MFKALLEKLAEEYTVDMVCAVYDLQGEIRAATLQEFVQRMGREPSTDVGEIAMEGRADFLYRILLDLGVVERLQPAQNAKVCVHANRAKALLALAKSWEA